MLARKRYLTITGGGVAAAVAVSAALAALEKQIDFKGIAGTAGASMGALAALLVALGYTSQEILRLVNNTNFEALQDSGCCCAAPFRLFESYGLYKGDKLYKFIQQLIREKVQQKLRLLGVSATAMEIDINRIIFEDLQRLDFKLLKVFTSVPCEVDSELVSIGHFFSVENAAQTEVALTVRASLSGQGVYSVVRLSEVEPGKYMPDKKGFAFSDGGIVNNDPIQAFDQRKYLSASREEKNPEETVFNSETLNIQLDSSQEITALKVGHSTVKPISDGHPGKYLVAATWGASQAFQNEAFRRSNKNRTIFIDRKGVGATDFSIDANKRDQLIAAANEGVQRYCTDAMRIAAESKETEENSFMNMTLMSTADPRNQQPSAGPSAGPSTRGC